MKKRGRGVRMRKRQWGKRLLFAAVSAFLAGSRLTGNLGEGTECGVMLAAESPEKDVFFALAQDEESCLASLRGQTLFVGVSDAGTWEIHGQVECGPAAPLLDVLRHEFGLELKIVEGSWEENRKAMEDGGLDFLLGVPAACPGSQGDAGDGSVMSEDGLYLSAWLYENPYVLVEYAQAREDREKESAGAREEEGRKDGRGIAYVAGDLKAEMLLSRITFSPGLYFGGAGFDDMGWIPCQNGEAVLAALRTGQADAALLPEDILFFQYPAADLRVSSDFSQYGSKVAAGTANPKLAPVLRILDRYLETTQEGDALRAAMCQQRESMRAGAVREQENDILENLLSRGENLPYAQAGLDRVPYLWHDAAGTHGELPGFLAFVQSYTGLVFFGSPFSGEDALQALEDGEILFAAGVPLVGGSQAYCFAGTCRTDRLVPAVPAFEAGQFSGEAGQGKVVQRYWGVVQELLPLLAGTVFDGHVVGFPDEETLLGAMGAGEIGGMLFLQGSLDAMALSGERKYAALEGIAFPVQTGLAFSVKDAEAAGLFGRLWQFYQSLGINEGDALAQFRAAYAAAQAKSGESIRTVWIYRGAVLLLAAALILALRRRRGKSAAAPRSKNGGDGRG